LDQSTHDLAVKLNHLLNEANEEDKRKILLAKKKILEPLKPVKSQRPLKTTTSVVCPDCGHKEKISTSSLKDGKVYSFQCDHCGSEYKAQFEADGN